MNLNVELISGDVNKVDGIDFLLIGHKNPLRKQICRETDSSFKSVDSESWGFPHQYELLEAPSYKWKQVAAIKFRANGKISETQFVRISTPIASTLKQPQIESIGILPHQQHKQDDELHQCDATQNLINSLSKVRVYQLLQKDWIKSLGLVD